MKSCSVTFHPQKLLLLAGIATISLSSACTKPSESKRKDALPPVAAYSLDKLGNRAAPGFGDPYLDLVQPVIARRCATCHSCTDGPCQLNMTSFKAIERGVHKINPYKVTLGDRVDTRVANNLSTEQWRSLGFQSILPGPASGLPPEESIFYKNLLRGNRNVAENPAFNQDEIRRMANAHNDGDYICPVNPKEYAAFEARFPAGGMPCALPKLPKNEFDILAGWVRSGGQGPSPAAQAAAMSPQSSGATRSDPRMMIQAWDSFLNQDSPESQLVSRYLYEHVFLANIHMEENPGEYYRLVRSYTPPPAPIDQIVTATAQDAPPRPGRVFYRMQKVDRVVEAKTNTVWRVNLGEIEHLKQTFFAEPWSVQGPPDYQSRNPFVVFEAIPTKFRAKFVRENARLLWQEEARGPVCFSQTPTYTIDGYILMLTLRPEADPTVVNPKLGMDTWENFYSKKINWKAVVSGDNRFGEGFYRQRFEEELRRIRPNGLNIDDIWDGDGFNPNAMIAGRRYQHSTEFDTGHTKKFTGFPRTVNIMTYASTERTFYNAVVDFKYWGNALHQNNTWDWQMYLRTEGEDLWASMFPDQAYRDEVRDRLNTPMAKAYYLIGRDFSRGRPAANSEFRDEQSLLLALFNKFGTKVTGEWDNLNNWPLTNLPKGLNGPIQNLGDWESGLRGLTAKPMPFARFFPNIVYIRIAGELYTIVAHRGYWPNKLVMIEKQSRRPEFDMVRAFKGMMGVAPELFIDLDFPKATAFLTELNTVRDPATSAAFFSKYKIPRNGEQFWPFVDWLNEWQVRVMPVEGGILELKYYDLSDVPF